MFICLNSITLDCFKPLQWKIINERFLAIFFKIKQIFKNIKNNIWY